MAKQKAAKLPAMPSKYRLLGKGNFPPVFDFVKQGIGSVLEGIVSQIKSVPTGNRKRKDKAEETRIMYVADADGVLTSVWESAALEELFNEAKPGDSVYIRYDGPVHIKNRKQPMKGFTTGITPGKAGKAK